MRGPPALPGRQWKFDVYRSSCRHCATSAADAEPALPPVGLGIPQRWEWELQNSRVVVLGTDIAKQLDLHFSESDYLFTYHCKCEQRAIGGHLLATYVADVKLLGPYEEEDPVVAKHPVLNAYGRAGRVGRVTVA